MIVHFQSMVAFVVDQVGQASAQDPLLARLFIATLPSLFALVVAWMVFRWNRKNDDRRWVLENKKAEWKALIDLASKVEQFTPSVAMGNELIDTVQDPVFKQHLREMTQTVLKCVFISDSNLQKIYSDLVKVQLVNEQSKGHIEDFHTNAHLSYTLGKPRPLQAAENVQSELSSIWREIRKLANEDLNPEKSQKWWNTILSSHKKKQL